MFQDCKEKSNPDFCGSGLSQSKVMTFRPKEVSLLLIDKDSFFLMGRNKTLKERSSLLIHEDNSCDI
jgi:hypothetical protein